MARDLSNKIEQARAQLQQLEARQREADRKRENRQKIVVGATVINAMRSDEVLKQLIGTLLKQQVKRPGDREVVSEWLPTT